MWFERTAPVRQGGEGVKLVSTDRGEAFLLMVEWKLEVVDL